MGQSPVPLSMLVEQLDRWQSALRDGRIEDARLAVKDIGIAGRMLAMDPEFRRLFAAHRTGGADTDPDAALESMTVFLEAVTHTLVPGNFRAGRSRA